jgi:hypothetical protein
MSDDIVVRCTNLGLPQNAEGIGSVLRRGYAASQDVSSLNLAASSGAAFFLSGNGYWRRYVNATA